MWKYHRWEDRSYYAYIYRPHCCRWDGLISGTEVSIRSTSTNVARAFVISKISGSLGASLLIRSIQLLIRTDFVYCHDDTARAAHLQNRAATDVHCSCRQTKGWNRVKVYAQGS